LLQEYSQHAADSTDLSESLVSAAADTSTVGKRSRVPSSQDDADEPACSMDDVIQLLQLLSAIASDTQSTGLPRVTSWLTYKLLAVVAKWMDDCPQAGKLSRYVASHTGQLSLAIPLGVGAMSNRLRLGR